MSKLFGALLATALSASVVAGSAHAAVGFFHQNAGSRPSGSQSGPTAGGNTGGGGFVGRPGGAVGGGQFFNRPGVNRGGFVGGTWRGGDWRWRGRRSFGVVFVDPWYDPFWPYGYGFGWGWGWYGPPYYYDRPAAAYEYGPPPQDYGPPPESYWYYCSNPDGYYPYVKSCNNEWQAVPATPPGGPAGPQNGPPPRTSALPENSPDAGGGG
ncbi:MAG TPA: hypothetical protein VEU06_02230 [Micropepsaceae bacterium]|nr:hypothetical protein [Micropepsaceae bacterium]